MGSDYDNIEDKDLVHVWIHPGGKVYVRKSFQYAIPGWKIDEKEAITDYWGKIWYRFLPAIEIFLKNNDFCNGGCQSGKC